MTVSTRKLPGLTDQSQKTPATILLEKKDLSSNEVGEAQKIMNIAKERDMNLKQKRAHVCFQHIHCSIVTFRSCQRAKTVANCHSTHVFAGMGRRLAVTTHICLYRWKYDSSHALFHTNNPLNMQYKPAVCFLRPLSKFRDICTTISFCWKHLINRHSDNSIDVYISHNISN